MAQQATVKRAVTTAQKGRPAGSKNQPKAVDYAELKMLSFQKPEDFYRYLEAYPDKTGLMAYIYRMKPKIDMSLVGVMENTIFKTANENEMTEDFVAKNYGRGLYNLKLSDANRPRGQQQVCQTWFEPADCQTPPQYDPRTLCLGDAKNLDEVNRLLNSGVLVRDEKGAPRLAKNEDMRGGPFVIQQPNGNGGGDLIGKEVVTALLMKAINGAEEKRTVSQILQDQIELNKLINPAPVQAATDPFTVYEKMESFLSKVRPAATVITDGAIPAGAAPWVPHVPAIIREARGFFAEVMAGISYFRGPQPPQRNGGASHAQPNPGAPQQAVAPQRQMTVQERIEEVAQMGFERMAEGVKGFDYAAWLCNFHRGGLEIYQYLEPGGVAAVMGMVAMNPATRPLANDPVQRQQIESFLSDFFTFDPSGGASEESTAGEEPPAEGAAAAS